MVICSKNGTMSEAYFNQRLKTTFGNLAPASVSGPADLHKIHYESQSEKGQRIILSGLLVLPRLGAPKGLVVFNHGTTADRTLSPSRFVGSSKSPEVELAALAFASGGYAIAMPDYLGLGDDKGSHPYPLGTVNSLSAVDIIVPARTAARRLGITVGPRLFVSGYSEGGAVAMWTVRRLEQKPASPYRVSAAALMSGPYDLSDTTVQSTVASGANSTLFAARLYLLAYMMHSLQKSGAIQLNQYFGPAMASVVSRVFDKGYTDEEIIKRLGVAAAMFGAKNSLDRITTTRFRDALRTGDPADPAIRALRENDCYDWMPRTKILLTCLQSDSVVMPANTQKAITAMRARGVKSDVVRDFVIKDSSLNHATAAIPSLMLARRFFDR